MNIPILSQNLVTFLAPFLPYLVKAGEKATEEIGGKIGGVAWEQAKAIWGKLHPKIEAKPATQEAIQDLAGSPDYEDAQTVLQIQLKKLLTQDTALAQEIAQLMEGKVVQRVLAERGSSISDVQQSTTGSADVRQEVIAQNNSIVENIRQRKQ